MRFVKTAIVAAGVSAAALAANVPEASAAPAGVPSGHVTPNPSAPGTATTFDVFCGRDAMSATLFGVTLGLADLILMHSTAHTMTGEFVVTVTLPANIVPGGYRPSFDCSNGCSDGLDRGDPAVLATAMERLARLSYRVVWMNPHKGDNNDFRPTTLGMMVAAPHIDLLLSGHDLASLEELAAMLPALA